MTGIITLFFVLVPTAIIFRSGVAVYRVCKLSPAGRRNVPIAVWARFRWRWLCRNQELAYTDSHRRRVLFPHFGTAVKVRVSRDSDVATLRYPKARIRADEFGIIAKVKTIPRSGSRIEFEAAAPYIADHWKCVRVQVSQPKPGRLVVRGLRRDPLLEPYGQDQAPRGAFGRTRVKNPLQLFMGIDAWAVPRWISLPGITGATIAGLPGRGKTELVNSWITQLDPIPMKLAIIDGKSSHLPTSDYSEWSDRAWLFCGDDPADAADVLNECYQEMRRRFANVLELTRGKKNAWVVGPTPDMPLLFINLDEASSFLSLDLVKGNPKAEASVRACRSLAGHLITKGRSVMVFTVTMTQKQDSAATSLAVRDNSGISVCFGVKTVDAAVSALGADVRDYPSLSPVRLQDDEYIGTCVTTLATGSDPYTMIRVPELARRLFRSVSQKRQACYGVQGYSLQMPRFTRF